MTPNFSEPELPPGDTPQVEVQLNVGDAVRIGSRILRVLDIEGDSSMLRLESLSDDDGDAEDSRWWEIPR